MSEKQLFRECAALYIRVSTHMQDELSPDAQKRLLIDYAKSQGLSVSADHVFIDSGISGRKADKRPEFQKMICLAKSTPAPFGKILVWKFSRFARNQEESIVYKSLLRKQCNIDVISISEPAIDGPFGSLIERIIEWMDEYYSTRLSGEVMRGMTEKALRGGYQACPPLGYKIIERGKPPVVVPEEAQIIKIIFEKYVYDLLNWWDIARYLNLLGFKTSHGKKFEARSVEYIVENPTYCGMIRWNRTTNETNEVKDKSKWIIAKGEHEAIISKELFDLAQERRKLTYRPKGTRPASTYKHWLSGLVKCPDCGRTMVVKNTSKKSGKKYFSFSCYGYCKGKCPSSNSISSMKLEPRIFDSLQTVIHSHNIVFTIRQQESFESIDELTLLQGRLENIGIKEKRIKDAYRDGIDTLLEYKENKIALTSEKNDIEKRIYELSSPTAPDVSSAKVSMLDRCHNVYEIITSPNFTDAQKNDALKSIIERIVYNRTDDTLKIYYYYA